jgi:predicted alpha/beta hydrolase family esterase
MKDVIILHGTLGSPAGNWFKWLAAKFESIGMTTWVPSLSHAEQPSLAEWAYFVRAECPFAIDENTLIIGHSSGAILALILAQQNPTPIGGVVAVSVFHDNSLNWEPNARLFDVAFDYELIRLNAKKLLFVHSDNDPYVPLEQARFVADNCHAELVVIPGQGHFNLEQDPEYTEFPALWGLLNDRRLISL